MRLKFTGGKGLNQPTLLFLFFPVKYSCYNSRITALWLYLLEFLASYKSLVSFDTLFLSRTLSQEDFEDHFSR